MVTSYTEKFQDFKKGYVIIFETSKHSIFPDIIVSHATKNCDKIRTSFLKGIQNLPVFHKDKLQSSTFRKEAILHDT